VVAETSGQWCRVKDVAARTVDGETILVPIRRNPKEKVNVVTLNDSASFVWACLDSPCSEDELAQRLTAEFEVDLAQARADVSQFLAELKGAGLLRASSAIDSSPGRGP
jgi:hypothetical protein